MKLDKDAKTPGFSKKDFLSEKPIEHIGIVKGIPQQSFINKNINNEASPKPSSVSSNSSSTNMSSTINSINSNNNNIIVNNNNNNNIMNHSGSTDLLNNSVISQQNDIINKSGSKERKQSIGSLGQSSDNSNLSNENLLDLYNHHQRLNNSNHNGNVFSPSPTISSSTIGTAGSLKPPAYRNPPAPKSQSSQKHNQNQNLNQSWSDSTNNNGNFSPILSPNLELLMHSVQYRDLVQLIKYQREKLNTQQAELTKVSISISYVYAVALEKKVM